MPYCWNKNNLHFKEDTMNFSGQDNYSCWSKERAGGAHTLGLNARIRQTIANEQCLPFGLLWRENELTIVLTKDGETVMTILGLLCVSDLGQWKLFF
ncbi:hypothetical protein pdam_00025008 [Pocillopora damicornis]|uniref:Uncharacterized protein n=1 Tax=Pocillopora damicornis TaxID=46731 RepID=A0A3M6TEW7_POCDA|nr:hypothetical protein pdam_00025008 [Pocillopora damicornis]